jgi:glycosyltransferase involved in cell wall biosynthesis
MIGPAVSVVIPAYNYARFLPRALASVMAQSLGDFEVVIVDDGSTDETPLVVRPFLADGRVRYHRIANGGPSRARNAGIDLARGGRVAFLDADDFWMADKLEKQCARFCREPSLGVVHTRRRLVDEQGLELEWREPAPRRGMVLEALLTGNFLCLSSCMVSRQVFDRVGVFDESLSQAEDYDLWLRAAEHFPFDFVDEPLVCYRVGHESLSRHMEVRVRSIKRILKRFLDRQADRSNHIRSLVERKWAGTCSEFALSLRSQSRLRALIWYARGLCTSPGHGRSWLGLGSLFLPEGIRRRLRRALGQPPDWRVRQRVGAVRCALATGTGKPNAAKDLVPERGP